MEECRRRYDRTLSLAIKLDMFNQAQASLGRYDLYYLLTVLLRRSDIAKPWLFERCREVQLQPNGCLDLWAREHGKSSIITFGMTIFDILNDPEITVGVFSHTRPVAKTFLRQIKVEFETNKKLIELYPEVLWNEPRKEAPKWSEDDGIVVRRVGNPKESTVEAWGLVDGQPTGRHFRLRVYDDVVTRESVTTPEQIEKTTIAWELSDNLGVQADQGGASRHIGTRYHLFDTYAAMLERGAVTPRIYPATHNGRFDGRPVLFTKDEWERRLRTQSRSTVASQLLQNPMADEAATFRPEWLRAYEVRPKTINVYIMADPSRGRSAESDNTAIAVVGVSATGGKYLLDGYCHQMTLSQRWIKLRDLYRKWSRAVGVQHIAVGYERYGAQSDDEYFEERMRIEAVRFTIEELNWPREGGNSKKERVERLEPDFRNGRFFLPQQVLKEHVSHNPRSDQVEPWLQPCVWDVDADPDSKTFRDVRFRPVGGVTTNQMRVIEQGLDALLARPIKCTDQSDRVYDLTLHFIEEFNSFPFGRWKDLVDATSRIFDMDPHAPTPPGAKADLMPTAYFDS